jgi:hypothetical protein
MTRLGRAAFVLVLVVGLGACGSSKDATSSEQNANTVRTNPNDGTLPQPAPTPTVTISPAEFDQGACRAFVSFDELIRGSGEDGPDAAGQLGGMIVQAESATAGGASQPGASKLLTDLNALVALAKSSTWKPTPAEASTPQFAAVAADCRAFPTPTAR